RADRPLNPPHGTRTRITPTCQAPCPGPVGPAASWGPSVAAARPSPVARVCKPCRARPHAPTIVAPRAWAEAWLCRPAPNRPRGRRRCGRGEGQAEGREGRLRPPPVGLHQRKALPTLTGPRRCLGPTRRVRRPAVLGVAR